MLQQKQPLRVAIQGDPASFHEIAATKYYTSEPIEIIYCPSFRDTFDALAQGSADRALVAIKNSAHGEIQEVRDLLDTYSVTEEGQYDLPIQQQLIGLPGTDLGDLTQIISHPVALSQCSAYLEKYYPYVKQVEYYDTSAAVKYIKELSDTSVVAIGSDLAAKLYDLPILQNSIQNTADNTTTFCSLRLRLN